MAATTVQEDLTGTVEKLHMAKPGFSAGRILCGGRRVSFSVKGYVREGLPVTLRGGWEEHPKWGRQFKASQVIQTMPADAAGVQAWLRTYAIGFGPVKAEAAVAEYGAGVIDAMRDRPDEVAAKLRLTPDVIRAAAEAWDRSAVETNTVSTLLGMGLTQAEAEKLYERYRGSAAAILEDNAYALLGEVDGFAWKRVDDLGERMGVGRADRRRVTAAVVHAVRVAYDQGSTFATGDQVQLDLGEMLGGAVSKADIVEAMAAAVAAGRVVAVGTGFALPGPFSQERALLRLFGEFERPNPTFGRTEFSDREIGEFTAGGKAYTLDGSQLAAVRLALANRGTVITGGAGVGKSTIATAIYRQYVAADKHVELCAPTGKAARRLAEVIGCSAQTIHRLLGYRMTEKGFAFTVNEDNPVYADLVIVDEVSMCDSWLLYSLLSAIPPTCAVVLLGDPNQLPPVGAGFPLRDMLDLELCPVARLTTCHRQAGPLARSSMRVLEGKVDITDDSQDVPGWVLSKPMSSQQETVGAVQFLVQGKLAQWGYAELFDHQFITAKHSGVLGTTALNELLQRLRQAKLGVVLPIRPPDERLPLLRGDKVINTRNDYELDVMNGTLGVVVEEDPLVILFEDGREVAIPKTSHGQISLAYCLTAHKMQGSQVPCAVVVVPKEHAFMQHRNWLYTAVTRARKTAVVLGDSVGIRRAAETLQVNSRRTVLEVLAKQEGVPA